MRLAKGPRPWSIRLFAAILVAAGVWNYIASLQAMADAAGGAPFPLLPDDLGYDTLIVLFSARLTIVLIPVAAIWFLGSRIAKWIITALTMVSLIGFVQAIAGMSGRTAPDWGWIALGIVTHGVVILLFTPSAIRWLAAKGHGGAGDPA